MDCFKNEDKMEMAPLIHDGEGLGPMVARFNHSMPPPDTHTSKNFSFYSIFCFHNKIFCFSLMKICVHRQPTLQKIIHAIWIKIFL